MADMLKVMNQRDGRGEFIPFGPITWVTCSLQTNEGGEKITLEKAVLVGNSKSNSKKRNPNHFENYTRNIRAFDGDRIMKVHIPLVTRFNNDKVTL